MKKLFLILPIIFFIVSCSRENKQIIFKSPAPVVEKVSPTTETIEAEEHKPFTVKVKILNPSPSLITYWIWKDKIAGYGTEVTITPDEEDGGKSFTLKFVATGEGYTSTEFTYTVNVKEVDDPPHIVSYSPEITTFSIKTGDVTQFSIEGEDPDSEVKYIWKIDGEEKGYSSNFTLSVTKEMEGKTLEITGIAESKGKSDSVKWYVTVIHYDYPPVINLPTDHLILSTNFEDMLFPKVLDLSKYISDRDNDFYQLHITFETSDNNLIPYLNGTYMALRVVYPDFPAESIKIKVSDGEKETSATLYLYNDIYLIFKNEYQYSLSLFDYNQLYSLGPVEGSESPYVISTISYGEQFLQSGETTAYIFGFTTWGAYHLLKYNPLSLHLIEEKDISYCASSPYSSQAINFNGGRAIVFTNFEKFSAPVTGERFSIYFPMEDTCQSYSLYTTGIDQDMSYEGIAVYKTKFYLTLFFAASGFQGFDYQTYRSIFGNSYLTMVTMDSLDPDITTYTDYNFMVTNCVNLQDVKFFYDNNPYLAAVCTGDYSYSSETDTGYLILFTLENGYPQEVTRISLGVASHPGNVTFFSNDSGNYLVIGSSSGKLFIVEVANNSLINVGEYSFDTYGYSNWSMVTPVVVEYDNNYLTAGAVVSSWGMDSTLFLKRDIENINSSWEHILNMGNGGASNWISIW